MQIRWAEDPMQTMRKLAQAVKRGLGQGLDIWCSAAAGALRSKAERPYRNGISERVSPAKLTATIASVEPVGMFREYGTGLYGPRKRRIVSKRGRYAGIRGWFKRRSMLRWVSDGNEVFARSVKGSPPRPWFWPTIRIRLKHLNATLNTFVTKTVTAAARATLKR